MTREEAIYRLKNMAWLYGSAEREQNIEAIDMAIEALQNDAVQEVVPTVVRVTMSDGSQYYLENERDALQAEPNCQKCAIKELWKETEKEDLVAVVRCKDCRYFKKIAERSDSGLCHRDLVASAWKENGYCSRGERREV